MKRKIYNFLKISWGFIFYKVKFNDIPNITNNNLEIYKFKLYPRKCSMIILSILLFIPEVLFYGISGWYNSFKKSFKIESWSSFEIKVKVGDKPSKKDAYLEM